MTSARRGRWGALLHLLALSVLVCSCGADSVDRGDEAAVLAATCRSFVERSTARVAPPRIDPELFAEALDREPGSAGDRSVAATLRRACSAATLGPRPPGVPGFLPGGGSGS